MINKINALIGFLRKYEILIRDALSSIVNKILSKSNFLFILPAIMMLIRGGRYLFIRPQLYAEDGAYWMSNAYSIGLKNITLPYASQYHTAEKLFAYASSFLPIEWQPFIYNLTAFIIFIIMCYLLLDKKSGIVRDSKQALILAFMLGLVQNIEELAFNFSNSVFYLGIIGVVLLWRNYSSKIKNSLKYVFYSIACVTLPFSLFYSPIALFRFVKNKKIDEAITLGISVLGAAAQIYALIITRVDSARVSGEITGTASQYLKYLTIFIFNQIVDPALMFVFNDASPLKRSSILVALFIVFIVAYLFVKYLLNQFAYKNYASASLAIFCVCVTISSMYRMLINQGGDLMINIINSSNSSLGGDRYYLFAIIALTVAISFHLSELTLKVYANYIVAMVIVTSITIMNGHFFIDKPGYLDLSDRYQDAAAQYRKTGVFESPTLPTGWGIGFEKEKK